MTVDLDKIVRELAEDQESVTINLLSTIQCNFTCGHCFYSCSPHREKLWMPDSVLAQVKRQICELNDIGIRRIDVNMIGGEVTMNFKEFDRIMKHVTDWRMEEIISSIEMTTNGWWLKEERFTKRFFEVVCRHNHVFGLDNNGLTVRISNSPWHDEFRPEWLQRPGALQNRLEEAWELEGVFWDMEKVCPSCYEVYEDTSLEECPDPDCEKEELEYQEKTVGDFQYLIPPRPDEIPWIYVDTPLTIRTVIPIGRGSEDIFGGNDRGKANPGNCIMGSYLSYKPNGTLGDICCRGSDAPFGTVEDHPIVLLALAQQFIEEEKPYCSDCVRSAKLWNEDHMAAARERFQTELDEKIPGWEEEYG